MSQKKDLNMALSWNLFRIPRRFSYYDQQHFGAFSHLFLSKILTFSVACFTSAEKPEGGGAHALKLKLNIKINL